MNDLKNSPLSSFAIVVLYLSCPFAIAVPLFDNIGFEKIQDSSNGWQRSNPAILKGDKLSFHDLNENLNLAHEKSITNHSFSGRGHTKIYAPDKLISSTQSKQNIQIFASATLENHGGIIQLASNHAKSDIKILGTLYATSGITSLQAGNHFKLAKGGKIQLQGGETYIQAGNSFITNGNASDQSFIELNGGAKLYINLAGGKQNYVQLQRHDSISLAGVDTRLNISGDANSRVRLKGTIELNDRSALTISAGNTYLHKTTTIHGDSDAKAGRLTIHGNIYVDSPKLVDAPNITIHSDHTTHITSANKRSTHFVGIGTLTKTGSGKTFLARSIHTIQSHILRLEAGTLYSATDHQIDDDTALHFAGGTWNTGGFSETVGSLLLADTSIIDLGNGNSTLQFADSSHLEADWNSTATLMIDNWSGDYLQRGGTDQIVFASAGLTASQLNQIVFRNPMGIPAGSYTAAFSGNEIIPFTYSSIPEPLTCFWIAVIVGLAIRSKNHQQQR